MLMPCLNPAPRRRASSLCPKVSPLALALALAIGAPGASLAQPRGADAAAAPAVAPMSGAGDASSATAAVHAANDRDCGCTLPWREYTRAPTPAVRALFKAAHQADEAAFMRLLPTIDHLADYAVDDEPLLAALLYPSVGQDDDPAREERRRFGASVQEAERLRAAHAATLPAKTRMLAAALQAGASVTDISRGQSNPPLHLALIFGTPDMVRLLLSHGANPNQPEQRDQRTPLEFVLDHEFVVRMSGLPELVTPAERSRMILALLAAGARRPYLRADDAPATDGEDKLPRPVADYLIWPALAEMTEGAEVLDAVARTGTTPAFEPDDEGLTVLGHAARAGNLAGLRWLLARAPRQQPARYDGEPARDTWLDAAIWALYPATDTPATRQRTDEILQALLVRGMAWGQELGLNDDTHNLSIRRRDLEPPTGGQTLLHHLVHRDRVERLATVAQLGAPVDGDAHTEASSPRLTPLALAVRTGKLAAVKQLLALGANPLAGTPTEDQPFFAALSDSPDDEAPASDKAPALAGARLQILDTLLATLTPEQKQALDAGSPTPVSHLLGRWYGPQPDLSLLRRLLAAGFSASGVDANQFARLLWSDDRAIALDLLAHGARPEAVKVPDALTDADLPAPSLLAEAVRAQRLDLIAPLARAGADPNRVGRFGQSAMDAAIDSGKLQALDAMLAVGGRLEVKPPPQPGRSSTLDLAVQSGSVAMTRRIAAAWGTDLSAACLPRDTSLRQTLLQPDDATWREWLHAGLGRPGACAGPSLGERLVRSVLGADGMPLVGWLAQRFSARLADLSLSAAAAAPLAQQAWREGREDVIQGLTQAGVPLPPPPQSPAARPTPPTARDLAARKRLAGHYYLEGVREVGSELLLRPDGRFEYMLTYGATDEQARGRWQVLGNEVVLRSDKPARPAQWQPYRLRAAEPSGRGGPADPAAPVSGVVRYQGHPANRVTVTTVGCDAPQIDRAQTQEDGRWQADVRSVCHIVLFHPSVNDGRPYVHTVAAAGPDAQRRHFTVDITPIDPNESGELNVELTIDKNQLLMSRNGHPMRYVRH